MRFSFRATLFSLMLAVLLMGVATLGVAAYLYARFAVGDLGGQVLDQAVERVQQHVRNSLDVAESEAATVENLIAQGWLDPGDHEAATNFFLASLRARPGLSYLSFGMPDGTYYHAFRDRQGNLSVLWLISGEGGERRLLEYSVAPDGAREVVRDIERSVRTPPYDRPYYRAAQEAGRPIWTESYVFLGSGESLDVPGVSRAVPVYSSEDDRFLGVLTADFDLFALSKFLRGVNLGSDGLCFLVEAVPGKKSKVIAHPEAANPDPSARLDLTEPSPAGEGRDTVQADRVPDPRVTRFLTALGTDLTAPRNPDSPIKVEAGDEPYVGNFLTLGGDGAPHWIICMLLPESDVFGGVRRMARLMAYLGLGGVLVAGLLSILLSHRVASSLAYITNETREIGQFRLARKDPVTSRIQEISSLASSVEEMKTGLRSFQKYVPSDLVRLLLETGQEAELGGTRSDLTVYFSDIVGFTSLSERLPPESLVKLLSEYLEEMSGEIIRSGGTLDKYIGDAIMAFWGAPLPHAGHAESACRAALACRRQLDTLGDIWRKKDLPAIRARIGLHTGSAIVGNFGSPNRLDFTAIGDTVNLASRLEGLNKIYGTDILISDTTRREAGSGFATRRLDKVAVKGREGSTLVYELVGEADTLTGSATEWISGYESALDLYFGGNWDEARGAFQKLLDLRPEDSGAEVMVRRCQSLLGSPPAEGWDGVFRAPKA